MPSLDSTPTTLRLKCHEARPSTHSNAAMRAFVYEGTIIEGKSGILLWDGRRLGTTNCRFKEEDITAMSINASIKSGKAMNDTSGRLTNMVSSSSRQRRENILKKKRATPQSIDAPVTLKSGPSKEEVSVLDGRLIR